jgi:hypothetical protein
MSIIAIENVLGDTEGLKELLGMDDTLINERSWDYRLKAKNYEENEKNIEHMKLIDAIILEKLPILYNKIINPRIDAPMLQLLDIYIKMIILKPHQLVPEEADALRQELKKILIGYSEYCALVIEEGLTPDPKSDIHESKVFSICENYYNEPNFWDSYYSDADTDIPLWYPKLERDKESIYIRSRLGLFYGVTDNEMENYFIRQIKEQLKEQLRRQEEQSHQEEQRQQQSQPSAKRSKVSLEP